MLMQTLGGSTAIAYYASSIFDVASNKLSTKFGNFRISILRHIQSLFQVPVVGSSVLLADKFGRRPLLLGYTITFSKGMVRLPNLIMFETFSINIKGSAGSLVTFLHNNSNSLVAYAFNFMIEWSTIETKGRTLEEIQRSIIKFSQ
ncbi:hypothetical protein CICLE_v10003519mg [Citrus x clementina]|uniref:Sugar transporter ERD6-like 5 n=3 Tax=Citrus TaxID=2706 RepID=A0ACB8KJY7_CITSI|nr:hypothetical protein CICLE_v10003519mg [Citrus x clementina]KAH9754769.1 Sugar transporter ERD6-like 5 [Citrus sinensis]KDO42693.1 hypothetical protein CISIN_1g036778mg [Citrus sinensis]